MLFPNSVVDYAVYSAVSGQQLGLALVTLPDITMSRDEIMGGGIAGRINVPVRGHTDDMNVTINYHTLTVPAISLLAQTGQSLIAYLDLQEFDNGANDFLDVAEQIHMRCFPGRLNLGKAEPGTKGECSVEMACYYLSIYMNGVKYFEHDKFGNTFVVNGQDYLAQVRLNTKG